MKKLNNNGFSLVELIIVIAIMAILVGVVGTQVIPYLESSRQGKDQQVFSAWNTAAMSAYSMCADKVDASMVHYITVTDAQVEATVPAGKTDAGCTSLKETFCELTGLPKTNAAANKIISSRMVSKAGKEVAKVKITIPEDANSNIITEMFKTGDAASEFDAIENK